MARGNNFLMNQKDYGALFELTHYSETKKLLYLQVLNADNALSYEQKMIE